MRNVEHNRDENGSAIVELCIAIPLFLLLICAIVEFGGMVIAYAAVDDAAYAVSHAYGVDHHKTEADLISIAASGPLNEGGITIAADVPTNVDEDSYLHHFPNTQPAEPHKVYSKKVTFTVTYDMQPLTIIGRAIAGPNNGMKISSSSSCIIDQTIEESQAGGGWWS